MKRILLIILVLLVIAQFVRPAHNAGEALAATDITHSVPVPDSVLRVLTVSCFDCHSDHTNYPWYSKIAPVSWWLNSHVNDGKRHLNFTTFNNYTFKKKLRSLDGTAKEVDNGGMPLPSYLWIHKDAKLSEAQKKMLIDWAKAAKLQVMQDSLNSLRH
jgi:Haem-binding domain